MSDSICAYIVTLETDINEDDEAIMNAIKMIKGVINVEPISANPMITIATARAKEKLHEKIFKAISE